MKTQEIKNFGTDLGILPFNFKTFLQNGEPFFVHSFSATSYSRLITSENAGFLFKEYLSVGGPADLVTPRHCNLFTFSAE